MRSLLPILPNSKKGFTLIEILVVSLILVILMGSITVIFLSANKSWNESEAKLQVYQNARDALNRMSKEIACAYQPSDTNKHLKLWNYSYADGDSDQLVLTAALNNPDAAGEYDLTHIGFKLLTGSGDPMLQRYKKDYDASYDGSVIDPDYPPTTCWKDLATNIVSLNIECYDSTIPGWCDTWNTAGSKNYLPKAIRITIVAEDKQSRLTKTFTNVIYIPTS